MRRRAGHPPREHPAFERVRHRPWPPPGAPWMWRQTWNHMLFAHWPVPTAVLRPLVPDSLTIDEFDGTSWVGLLPFHMTGVSLRRVPDLPWLSAFPEMNLRLYVTRHDKPGIWFVSLDASNSAATAAARLLADLPYFWSSMRVAVQGACVHYRSTRLTARRRVVFRGTYWPEGLVHEARRGTLEYFLTERYCLYTQSRRGQLERIQVHHWPWPLQRAGAAFDVNTVASAQGIDLPSHPPVLHYARRLDVVGWGIEKIPS
jgi:uncharacterized protein